MSEGTGISLGSLDCSLCFMRPSVSHDVCSACKLHKQGDNIYSLDGLLSLFRTSLLCSMSTSNCCFLTCRNTGVLCVCVCVCVCVSVCVCVCVCVSVCVCLLVCFVFFCSVF